MTIKFLLFRGGWESESNFWALESEQSILLFAAGEDAPFINPEVVNYNYLIKNKTKLKAIILNNALPRNCASLLEIYQKLSCSVPLYTSQSTFLILSQLFSLPTKIKDKFIIFEPNKSLKIGNFYLRTLNLNSYVLGNLALMVNYQDYTFYYLTDFVLSNLLNSNYLSDNNFFTQLKDLLSQQKEKTYLITSCPNLTWNKQNSLLLLARNWTQKGKNYFFLLYEYDWLHILELCELAHQWKKKIHVLDPNFLALLKKVLKDDKLRLTGVLTYEKKDLVNENVIYLLIGSPTNLKERLKNFFEKFIQKDTAFTFIVGTSVAHLGEEETASTIDYLYQQKGEIYNLSRSETFSLGTSFADLKLLLEIIQPHSVITLQNSYKQKKYLVYLKNRFLTCPNQTCLDFSNQKIRSLPVPKESQEFEDFLLTQRQNLFQNGFLVVLITVKQEKKVLKIKSLQLKIVALAPKVDLKKLESKIRQWWEKKNNSDLIEEDEKGINPNSSNQKNLSELPKNWRKKSERYLAICIERYFNFEYDIKIKDPVILLFVENKTQPATRQNSV